MTDQESLRELIVDEGDAAEETRDQPIPDDAESTRPGLSRASVFSVRLNAEEMDAVTAAARARGVPASTLARSLILLGLRAGLADGPSGTALDPSLRTMIHDEVAGAIREALAAREVA